MDKNMESITSTTMDCGFRVLGFGLTRNGREIEPTVYNALYR